MTSSLIALDRWLGVSLRAISISCLVALFCVLLLFAWMVFAGAAALWREGEHFRVDWFESKLPACSSAGLRLLVISMSLAFLVVMTWKGIHRTLRSRALTPILGLPSAWLYASIPLAGALM